MSEVNMIQVMHMESTERHGRLDASAEFFQHLEPISKNVVSVKGSVTGPVDTKSTPSQHHNSNESKVLSSSETMVPRSIS